MQVDTADNGDVLISQAQLAPGPYAQRRPQIAYRRLPRRAIADRTWTQTAVATMQPYSSGSRTSTPPTLPHLDTAHTEERQEQYSHLTEVAAMPVVNANGRLIGVLSVSHSQDRVILGTDEGYRKHAALASSMSRIVVDLLGWRTDEPRIASS